MDEQKIIFSNRFEKEKFEDYKTDLGTGNTITPDFIVKGCRETMDIQ